MHASDMGGIFFFWVLSKDAQRKILKFGPNKNKKKSLKYVNLEKHHSIESTFCSLLGRMADIKLAES